MHPCCRFFFQETGVANHTSYWVYIHTQQATRSHGIGAIKWRFVLHKASVQSPIDQYRSHINIAQNKKQNTESPSCSHKNGEDVEAMELAAALAPVTRCAWPVYTAAINDKFLQVVVLVVIGALAVMVLVGVIVILIFLALFEMTVIFVVFCFPWSSFVLCSFGYVVLHICACVACSSNHCCLLFVVIFLLFSSLVYSLLFWLLPLSLLFLSSYMDSVYNIPVLVPLY